MSKVKLSFTGEIYDDNGIHKFRILHRNYFQTRIQKSKVGNYTVTLDDGTTKRSSAQNRYYWSHCLPLVAEEHGGDVNELHEYFRRALLPPKFVSVMGKEVKLPRSTTELDKIEFGEYPNKIEAETGVLFISPCEAGYFCGKKSCIICNKK